MSGLTMQATTTAGPPTGVAVCFCLLVRNSAIVWAESVQPKQQQPKKKISRDYSATQCYNITLNQE